MDIYQMCRYGDADLMSDALQKAETRGINVKLKLNKQNYFGRTPLHYCSRFGNLECAKILIEKYNTTLNLSNKNNWNILHDAARFGHHNIIEYIINLSRVNENVAKVVKQLCRQQNNFGNTPLHLACRHGDMKTVQLLYDYSDRTILNKRKMTILHVACEEEHIDLCLWIIEKGDVDLLSKDMRNATAIQYIACSEKPTSLVVLKALFNKLGEKGYGLTTYQDSFGNTPLHYVCYMGFKESVEYLCDLYEMHSQILKEKKTHPLFIENYKGVTPFQFASKELKDFLIKHERIGKYFLDKIQT